MVAPVSAVFFAFLFQANSLKCFFCAIKYLRFGNSLRVLSSVSRLALSCFD